MAEGLLGSALGEEERAEAEALERADIGAVAFAAAVAADQAARDPGVARATEAFLKEQTRLLKVQREDILEQRALRLDNMHAASTEGALRRFGLRLRNGMQLFAVLIVAGLGLGLLLMLADALTSRQVVVEAFKAPPALAGRGITGELVASGVLDTLRKLQAGTRTTDKALVARSAWASDVKIEVPETGVSIGEVSRLLHARLGHDLHIDGDLVQTGSGGLVLTVRGDSIPAASFSAGPEELETLTAQAAEYVYGQSQPIQYGAYLIEANRLTEAVSFIQSALPRAASDDQRMRLTNGLGNALSGLYRLESAAQAYRLALGYARPRSQQWWKIWGNLIGAEASGRGEEAGWRAASGMLRAMAAAPRSQRPEPTYLANAAQNTWDLQLMLQALQDDARLNRGAGSQQTIDGPSIADVQAFLHDPAEAARSLATSDPADPATKAEALFQQGYWSLQRGDAAAAVAPLQAFHKLWLADPNLQYSDNFQGCYAGLALGLVGRLKEAEAVFDRIGPWSLCHAFRGDVLAHAGDAAGAQKAWAEGQRLLPDLAAVPLHRGLFELGRGELKAAEADVAMASAKAPHWADPLKAWGDVLAREGRWSEALKRYDAGLKYAPAWAELRQARAAAALRAR